MGITVRDVLGKKGMNYDVGWNYYCGLSFQCGNGIDRIRSIQRNEPADVQLFMCVYNGISYDVGFYEYALNLSIFKIREKIMVFYGEKVQFIW